MVQENENGLECFENNAHCTKEDIMIQENEKHIALAKEQFTTQNNMLESSINNAEFSEQTIELFRQGISALTQTEKLIYDLADVL